uniref:Uncharacterized protein n=1 Tax=Anguilla anguilla TaxID=7936 RepID=A0A0E9S9L8_ANGAN
MGLKPVANPIHSYPSVQILYINQLHYNFKQWHYF